MILFYSFGLDFQKLFLNDRKQKKFNEHFLFIIIDLSEMFSDSRWSTFVFEYYIYVYVCDCICMIVYMWAYKWTHNHIYINIYSAFLCNHLVMSIKHVSLSWVKIVSHQNSSKTFMLIFFFLCMGACNLFFVMNSFESFEYRFLKKKILQHNGYTCSFNHLKKDCLKFNIFILNCHKNA